MHIEPRLIEAYNHLATLFNGAGQPDAAAEYCRRGLAQAPDSPALYGNMAIALKLQGRTAEAIPLARRAVELWPESAMAHSNLLYDLLADASYSPEQVLAEHRAWAARHAEPLTRAAQPHANDRTPDRRLRVGYVSPYFREHAVNYFFEPILAAHDHRQFEIFCYSDVRAADTATARLRAAADAWRDVRRVSDDELARRVRDDAIDILVDLSGHIAGNRLLALARRPAPVQVSYLGYQATTGMTAIGYRLTDEQADPPGLTESFYTERLVRLPRSFFCYRPADEPPVDPLPALAAGHVTFGSFNNYFKVNGEVLDTWLEVLERVPRSRLLVLAYRGGYAEQQLAERAARRGVDPARIEMCDKRSRREFGRLVARADIALDPFPFNGHTTSCDALWLGVPVVMMRGRTYVSRFGGSVLVNVGLEHQIADSRAAYVDAAVRLASDLPALAALRGELRPRMAASPLLDAAAFTRNLEQAYRQMWRTWCESGSAGPASG